MFRNLVLLGMAVALSGMACDSSNGGKQPPVADAGADGNALGGENVALDGASSRDPDGGSLDFQWSQTAGPTVTLTGADTAMAAFLAPNANGSVRFQLLVTDDEGLTASDTVTVNVVMVDNVPPLANAGSDGTVRGGEISVLDGSASTDDDGDPLGFAWVQTAGPTVQLLAADTSSPSFTAPNEDEALTFRLTVDDGNGHTDTDEVTITITRNATVMFVANLLGASVNRYVEPGERSGNVAPDTVLAGEATLLDGPVDIIVTREQWLIAANRASNSLNLYLASVFAAGDAAPFSVVSGTATLLDRPTGLEYDADRDWVYVSNTGTSSGILVFAGPSKVFFGGDLAPQRVLTSSVLNLPAGLVLDGQDRLYVANTGSRNILVFEDASSADGAVAPSRVLTSGEFSDPIAVEIDAADNLYVVNTTGTILVFSDAAAQNGAVTADATLRVSGAKSLAGLAVDLKGRGFVLDPEGNAILTIEGIASRSGSVTPNRTVAGDETGLSGPSGLFLIDE